MWQTSYTSTTDLPVRAVWDALRKIHTGEVVSAGGDTFEIHGPYEVYRVAIWKTLAARGDENCGVVRRRRNTLVRVVEPVEVYGAGSSGAA
jgi:hypothetical protein